MSVIIELLPAAGPALIVGGGNVGLRKARNLAEGEFRFTVVAAVVREEFRMLPFATIVEREFEESDIDGAPPWALVFACTDDRDVNALVGRLARARNIPVVVTDRQGESTFFTPATMRDGEIAVAVSTGGASPGLARMIRQRIAASLGPGWGAIAAGVRGEREARLAKERSAPQ